MNPDVNQKLGISLGMEVDKVRQAIEDNPDAVAVFVNNPTYYGICSDIKTIVELAHARGMKVLADEAHGTHLYFGKKSSGVCNGGRSGSGGGFHAQIRRKPDPELSAPVK